MNLIQDKQKELEAQRAGKLASKLASGQYVKAYHKGVLAATAKFEAKIKENSEYKAKLAFLDSLGWGAQENIVNLARTNAVKFGVALDLRYRQSSFFKQDRKVTCEDCVTAIKELQNSDDPTYPIFAKTIAAKLRTTSRSVATALRTAYRDGLVLLRYQGGVATYRTTSLTQKATTKKTEAK
jgi:hypothetical protein